MEQQQASPLPERQPDPAADSAQEAWKREYAWKILLENIGFSKHFDAKPTPILAMSAILGAYVTNRLGKLLDSADGLRQAHWAYQVDGVLTLLIVLPLAFAFISILCSLLPSLASGANPLFSWPGKQQDQDAASLIFFDDIARRFPRKTPDDGARKWLKDWAGQWEEDFALDVADQIVENARIVHKKAAHLRRAGRGLLLAMVLVAASLLFLPLAHFVLDLPPLTPPQP